MVMLVFLRLDTCMNLTLTGNRAKGLHCYSDTNLLFNNNWFYWSEVGLDYASQIMLQRVHNFNCSFYNYSLFNADDFSILETIIN